MYCHLGVNGRDIQMDGCQVRILYLAYLHGHSAGLLWDLASCGATMIVYTENLAIHWTENDPMTLLPSSVSKTVLSLRLLVVQLSCFSMTVRGRRSNSTFLVTVTHAQRPIHRLDKVPAPARAVGTAQTSGAADALGANPR